MSNIITFNNVELHLQEHTQHGIISKLKTLPSRSPHMAEDENIVKRTCKELGITQKDLAERLDVPQPTMARWATGEVPDQSKKLLELFLENIRLKEDLKDTAKALKVLDKIKGYE